MLPKLAILVPCYNEEEVLLSSIPVLKAVLDTAKQEALVHPESWITLINDGSCDKTWAIIEQLHEEYAEVEGICLSRNFGHQNALWCALNEVEADLYISIDADLQDDEAAIHDMLKQYHQGHDIVYGVRNNRDTDTWFKRTTAQCFYKFLSFMGVDSVYNHADYRLMSYRAVCELRKFRETNLYLRGLVPLIGFPSTSVYYKRKQRKFGESKYHLAQMLKLAWVSVTSLSDVPLRMASYIGMLVSSCGVLLLLWTFVCWLQGDVVTGWTSLVGIITMIGGIQLLIMGMIGEYIANIFESVKNRPKYVVQNKLPHHHS